MTMKLLLLSMLLSLLTIDNYGQDLNQYEIIYEANHNGEPIKGDLETLVDYVQNGNPVRVGWVLQMGFSDPEKESIEMQHWVDAGFLTTIKGHVFAQISSIYQQGPMIGDPPGVLLINGKPDGWVAIVGTTGILRQKFDGSESMIDIMRADGYSEEDIKKELKAMESQKVLTKWAVLKK